MLNKVSKKECLDAIHYFYVMGMIDNGMCSDERYYCEILMNKVANDYKLKLIYDERIGIKKGNNENNRRE